MDKKTGEWLYMGGLAVALLAGVIPGLFTGFGLLLLLALGVLVGYMNVKSSESVTAMVATIGLPIAASALRVLPTVGALLQPILDNVIAFASGAAIVVVLMAFHNVYSKK